MTEVTQEAVAGYVLRGPEQDWYFIPEQALAGYRLTEEAVNAMGRLAAQRGGTEGYGETVRMLPAYDSLTRPRIFVPAGLVHSWEPAANTATPIQLP